MGAGQGDVLAIVSAWQESVNRRDLVRLRELSDPAIAIVGPRGVGEGFDLLAAWLDRAGLTLETRRSFARGEVVVLAQHGVWWSVATGERQGEAAVASVFHVRGGRLARYARHDALDEALASAGLSVADEVRGNQGRDRLP